MQRVKAQKHESEKVQNKNQIWGMKNVEDVKDLEYVAGREVAGRLLGQGCSGKKWWRKEKARVLYGGRLLQLWKSLRIYKFNAPMASGSIGHGCSIF